MDFDRLVSCARVILLSLAAAAGAAAALGAQPTGAHRTAQILAPDRIRDLLPSSLDHLARGDISAERVTALGVEISEAEAQYRDNNGHYVTLRIEDMGGESGLKSLVPWASTGKGKQTSSGDAKTYVTKGREVHEQWSPPTGANSIGYGQYAVVVGQRYLVEASGKVAGIGSLKSAVRRVDLAKLKPAKNRGVRGR
ncbi:MAG: hypothetical protein ACREUT_04135 [Steroidobacteraceae bacterium]